MIALVEERRQELIRLCRQYLVERLELFGSATGEEFDPEKSDLDFLVQFGPCTPDEHYERYFGLLEALEDLFEQRIDLVELGALKNPYFIRRVNESRQLLYAA